MESCCVCVWEVVVCGSRACTCANNLCAAFSCITWICASNGSALNDAVDTSASASDVDGAACDEAAAAPPSWACSSRSA